MVSMEFLNRFFRKQKAKSYDSAQWQVLYPSDVIERNLLENNKEWVFIATDKVAKAVSAVRFKVMRYQRSGDDQEVFEGPLVDFLENPAEGFTGKDFIYLDTAYKELTGNAFWELDRKKIIAPLVPTQVGPILSGSKLTGFKYQDGVTLRTLSLDAVLHDRYIDPARPYWGVGKLQKIARWVDTSSYANEFLRLFFVNGAQFGGFIKTEEESEERIRLIKVGLDQNHTGVEKSHKIAVLPKGAEFQESTSNMAEMEMGATDDRYRDKILSGFGVPKTLVGFTTEVNRASAEASEYIFAKYTVKPIVDDFIEFLNTKVAPLHDSSGKFYFAYEEFVPENMDVKLREREIALNRQPYMTVNEVRASVGLPPVEGGDVVYGSPLQMPLGTLMSNPDLLPGGEEDENEEAEEEPKKAIPRRARVALGKERMIEGIAAKVAEITTAHHDPDADAHKNFVSRVDAHEKLVANKVRDFNNRQQRGVTQKLAQITRDISKGDLFEMDEEVRVLIDFVSPMLRGLLIEQAIDEYEAQGFGGTFDQNQKNIAKIVALAAKRLSKSYNNTTALLLKKALNDGIQAGDDLTQLSERISQVYEYSNQVRATMVAKTESFYIANEGSREAYRQSGVVTEMRWYTAEDELVCEFCGPENGRSVGVNETFHKKGETITGANGGHLDTNYRAIDVPPLHTNCRCFIRPETIEVT